MGAFSVVGSPMVDSHSSPCLCLDALPTCNLGIGDSLVRKQKQLPRLGTMELSTSFVDLRFSAKCVKGNYKNLKKQTKGRKNLRIVNDLGGQYEESFSDIKTVSKLQHFLLIFFRLRLCCLAHFVYILVICCMYDWSRIVVSMTSLFICVT